MRKLPVYMLIGFALIVSALVGNEDATVVMLIAIAIALTNLDRPKK